MYVKLRQPSWCLNLKLMNETDLPASALVNFYGSLSSCSRINLNKSLSFTSPRHLLSAPPNQRPETAKKKYGTSMNGPGSGTSLASIMCKRKIPPATHKAPMKTQTHRVTGTQSRSRFSQRFNQRNSSSDNFTR